MTDQEFSRLRHFYRHERRQDGKLIQWTAAHFLTFYWLDVLRERLGAPIEVIRETHLERKGAPNPWDHTAVDFKPKRVPLWQAISVAERLDDVSLGWYATGSGHMDLRPYDPDRNELPARWLAIEPAQGVILEYEGLAELVTERTEAWWYLTWSHALSVDALKLVCRLADGRPDGGRRAA